MIIIVFITGRTMRTKDLRVDEYEDEAPKANTMRFWQRYAPRERRENYEFYVATHRHIKKERPGGRKQEEETDKEVERLFQEIRT